MKFKLEIFSFFAVFPDSPLVKPTTIKPKVTTNKPNVTTRKPRVTTNKPNVTTRKPKGKFFHLNSNIPLLLLLIF